MEAEEVQPYIDHRLRNVGWQGRPRIAEEAVEQVFERSGGIPRSINQIMTRAMLMAALEDSDVVSDSLMVAVISDLSREEEAGRPVAHTVASDISSGTASALITDDVALDIVARITMLEAQVAEQEATLRRVLNLLIDWVERENVGRRVPVAAV
jgi:hypothetical protein